MPAARNIAFCVRHGPVARGAGRLVARYGAHAPEEADVIVALGGDGFMLQTLHATQASGRAGLWHEPRHGGLPDERLSGGRPDRRLEAAEEAVINPLHHERAPPSAGEVVEALAINEVSLLRAGPQAAKLRITSTGGCGWRSWSATARWSARLPDRRPTIIRPMGRSCPSADVLAVTAVAAFRPRRWRGALLPKSALVRIDVVEPDKRPVMADADSRSVANVVSVEIRSEPGAHRLCSIRATGWRNGLMREQFT
jgi:NAD+ kinase